MRHCEPFCLSTVGAETSLDTGIIFLLSTEACEASVPLKTTLFHKETIS